MRRSFALTLALLTVTSATVAQPTPRTWSDVGITVTIPAGFTALPTRNPTANLLGTWRREGARDEGPILLQLVHLGAVVPQRPLVERERAELRSSDPYPFVDTPERARALGFELDALVGRTTLNGHAALRLVTAVPLVDDSVLVVVLAPSSREREARDVFRDTLASCRGETSWQTPSQRVRTLTQRVCAVVAITMGVVYALLALTVFRRRDAWHKARGAALLAMGALWLLVAVLVPWGQWGALVRALLLAAVFLRHGATKLRAQPSDASF
jgi:hypothetical protein